MSVTYDFITFFLNKEKLRNFLLMQFSVKFDTDENATFSLLTYLRLTHISYTEIGNFPDDYIFLND